MTTYHCTDCMIPFSLNAEEDPTFCPHCGDESVEQYDYTPKSGRV